MEQKIKQVENNIQFILIDDDHINNFCAKAIIKTVFNNPEIIAFTDPQAGLDHLKNGLSFTENGMAILFLDINMPVLNGWDVLNEFGKIDNDIRKHVDIYMVSSSVDKRDRDRALSYPFVSGFISKPLPKDFHKYLDFDTIEHKIKIA